MRLLLSLTLMFGFASAGWGANPTTYDGKYDISTINLTVVYFIPKDRKPLPDWKERIDYYVNRIETFHARELGGISKLKATLIPKPVVSEMNTAHFRRGNQDRTFFDTMDDVKALIKWKKDREGGFPILLVMSDFNWRELDDFTRTRQIDGKPVFEGNISNKGRHFPGAESGGSRAIYDPNQGFGMGLVSADGWRVPYSGSDCVVYHEGLGHTIGLPHPEPIDETVMGTAQYHFWISEAKLNESQKKKLGWTQPAQQPDVGKSLYARFTAIPQPADPKQNEEARLSLRWPNGAEVKSMTVRIQTSLLEPWKEVGKPIVGKPPATVSLGKFDKATPVSYRIDVALGDGQKTELWGYFQVK